MIHTIGRFSVKAKCSDQSNAFTINKELTEGFSDYINNELGELLDTLCTEDEVIIIPKIEIDLGKIKLQSLNDTLKSKLSPLLREKILQSLSKARHMHDVRNTHIVKPAILSGTSFVSEDLVIKSHNDRYFELFLTYLEKGFIPFSFNKEEFKKYIQQLFSPPDEETLLGLIPHLSYEHGIKRLASMMQFEKAQQLLQSYFEKIKNRFHQESLKFLEVLITGTSLITEIKKILLSDESLMIENILKFISQIQKLQESAFDEPPVFAKGKIREIPLSISQIALIWSIFTNSFNIRDTGQKDILIQKWLRLAGLKTDEFIKHGIQMNYSTTNDVDLESNILKGLIDYNYKKDEIFPELYPEIVQSLSDGIIIENAGSIILNPFLPALFNNLGYLDKNGNFIDECQQSKAIFALDYMVNGDIRSPEYELFFFKILTGWETEKFITLKGMTLSEFETNECDDVLHSIIEHWTILKSTSVETLRNQFLKRSGRLNKTDSGWNLKIQRNSFDVLIDHIPWNYSVVKYKWTNETIFTEW